MLLFLSFAETSSASEPIFAPGQGGPPDSRGLSGLPEEEDGRSSEKARGGRAGRPRTSDYERYDSRHRPIGRGLMARPPKGFHFEAGGERERGCGSTLLTTIRPSILLGTTLSASKGRSTPSLSRGGRPITNSTTHGTNPSEPGTGTASRSQSPPAAADGSTLLTALSLSKWSALPEGACPSNWRTAAKGS